MTVLNVPAQHTVTLSIHTHDQGSFTLCFIALNRLGGGTSRTIDSILSCICALWEGGMVARIEKKETYWEDKLKKSDAREPLKTETPTKTLHQQNVYQEKTNTLVSDFTEIHINPMKTGISFVQMCSV